MAKPSEGVPTWASDETNNTEPSALQKAGGWSAGQDGVSSYDNWFKNITSKWLAYLNAGVFSGAHTFADTLTVTGLTTHNGETLFNADARVATGSTLNLEGDAKINHGEKRRAFPPPTATALFAGTGTGASSHDAVFDHKYTLSLTGGKVLDNRPEFVPGDRITKIRLVHASPGGAPNVHVMKTRYAGVPGFMTATVGATVILGGTYQVTEYTVDSPVALGHVTGAGALPVSYPERFAVYIEATADVTPIHGYEILYDSVDVPADIA